MADEDDLTQEADPGLPETASEDAGDKGPAKGAEVIKAYLRTLPGAPGVYRMVATDGRVLYVGKAKDLKKRVAAYTHPERQSIRIRRMISETVTMEFVTTRSEVEALLLEANLIKRFAPRFNILLRDDKSFPFILVTNDHDYPQVLKYRGAKSRKGDYFGPFASVWAVNDTLNVLQKAFLLRTCTDAVFSARTRPCLLHQIKRCSAPCVNRISREDYEESVAQARSFLTGGSQAVQKAFAEKMQQESEALEFEKAAQYRDRIRALTRIQAHQDITVAGVGDADVVALHQDGGQSCVQVFFIRAGANYGTRAYYPAHGAEDMPEEVLEAFLGQFYARVLPPAQILLSHDIPHPDLLAEALAVRAERKVTLNVPKRGDKVRVIQHALDNAREALGRRMAESSAQRKLLDGLADALGLDGTPERIEIYDNSHVAGTNAVGGMVVAGIDGFMKNAYRKFNIKSDVAPGDDFGMMREVMTRRFSRAIKEDPDRSQGQWPDLVLIDGGKGQLSSVLEVLEDLGVDDLAVAAVSKGPDRNAGREQIHMPGRDTLLLKPRDPVLYFIQRLRDEAHRFAIGAHRQKRGKSIQKSLLDDIPGVGPGRKKALLHHFGSAKGVKQARLEDLEAVEGISKALAQKIHDWFHPTE